jgi:hypothetical protein
MRRVFRFLDSVLIIMIVSCLLATGGFFLAFDSSSWTAKNVLTYAIVPLALGAGLAMTFKVRAEVRANLTMALLFSALSLYGVEAFLEFRPSGDGRVEQPRWDYRNRIEVVLEMRASGEDAYPILARLYEAQVWVEERLMVPVAGIGHVPTVVCNETGDYFIYRADRYGFNNPDALWRDAVDIALLGDSFVQGACVPSDESFASVIRARHPATLNLGYGDHGPLSELVTLYEYLAGIEPAHVLWFFYETNDLFYDLPSEMRNDIFGRYLEDPRFRQDLMARAEGISQALRKSFDMALPSLQATPEAGATSLVERLIRTLKLTELRLRLGLTVRPPSPAPIAEPPEDPAEAERLWDLWASILQRAKATVGSWGGELHFIYLPGIDSFLEGQAFPYHDRVVGAVEDLGIPVLDLRQAFADERDPLSLFPPVSVAGYDEQGRRLMKDLHYNENGHQLVADEILGYLAEIGQVGNA